MGDTVIDKSQYDYSYSTLNINIPQGGTSDDKQIIGSGNVIITGKPTSEYKDTSIKVPFKVRVGTAPSLQGLGTYSSLGGRDYRVVNLNVNNNVHKYSEITLPDGFE